MAKKKEIDWLTEVRKNGWELENVPAKLKTAEVCLEAVRKNGRALGYVPENLRTTELCLEAVRQNGGALQHVPEELKTAELCFEAVRQAGWVICYVPEKLLTAKLCLEAVRNDSIALGNMPTKFRTAEVCLEAVRHEGHLYCVPVELRNDEVCLTAIRNDITELAFVPVQTFEMCVEAAKHDNLALNYVDHKFRTTKLLKAAGIEDGYDDDEEFPDVADKETDVGDNDESTVFTITCKGDPAHIETMQKIARRLIEGKSSDEWREVWTSKPWGADSYSLSRKKNFCVFEFAWWNLTPEMQMEIVQALENLYLFDKKTELFAYTVIETSHDTTHRYYLFKDSDEEEPEDEWNLRYVDYDNTYYSEVCGCGFNVIEKRRALWLVEDSGDSKAIAKAKKEFEKAREIFENSKNCER